VANVGSGRGGGLRPPPLYNQTISHSH